jgi:hypothetical protein
MKLTTPHEYRGFFIEVFAKMEASMNDYISIYYFNKDADLLLDFQFLILERFSFGDKKEILRLLLNRKSEADFISRKFGNHKRNYGKLIEKIAELGRIRNQFAHYGLAVQTKYQDTVINLMKFRDNPEIISISKDTYFGYIDKMEEYTLKLIQLMNE